MAGSVQGFLFFFGFLSASFSGMALLKMMPPKGFAWGRSLHILVALSQFWTALIYLLVIAGVLLPETYARFLYPVGVLILSPGWVVFLTQELKRRRNGSE